ncbi:hypothetical protein AWB64_05264 [Caballeronia sordidicola]|uniref:Uncharacterized protein n=1 Tax=Caballeronia sordidicola TaxID=196367 RepID=A0A158I056_CABSO|nr:hypothetical protein [Caballeronia sordidicola]SAL49995.1 hypothetical protein AWB64_05264 [Caballeronia sordidicola]
MRATALEAKINEQRNEFRMTLVRIVLLPNVNEHVLAGIRCRVTERHFKEQFSDLAPADEFADLEGAKFQGLPGRLVAGVVDASSVCTA